MEYKHVQVKIEQNISFYAFDLDAVMTLVLTSDLDIAKIHLYTQNEGPSSCGSKVIARADRQMDRQQKLLKLSPTGTHRQLKFLTLNWI